MMRRTELFRLKGTAERHPAIDRWMKEHAGEMGAIAQEWFEVMRKCGDEVREVLHDGCPTACLGDTASGYVNVFTSHVSVGFFQGASLPDPAHRQVHAPSKAETGDSRKRRGSKKAHRSGSLGY